jgi:hypothetical protein
MGGAAVQRRCNCRGEDGHISALPDRLHRGERTKAQRASAGADPPPLRSGGSAPWSALLGGLHGYTARSLVCYRLSSIRPL